MISLNKHPHSCDNINTKRSTNLLTLKQTCLVLIFWQLSWGEDARLFMSVGTVSLIEVEQSRCILSWNRCILQCSAFCRWYRSPHQVLSFQCVKPVRRSCVRFILPDFVDWCRNTWQSLAVQLQSACNSVPHEVAWAALGGNYLLRCKRATSPFRQDDRNGTVCSQRKFSFDSYRIRPEKTSSSHPHSVNTTLSYVELLW